MTDVALDKTADGPVKSRPRMALRQIAAVVAGNALEFYDFLTFSFFTVQIGHAFFPNEDEDTKVLSTLAIFGAGFLMRPLGAFVIGRWGDRVGRKPAMFLSFTLMGIAIVALALTPSFAVIGWAAPFFFLCFRLLQGFALGGEVGPTTAYLLEAAPPMRRGLYASLQYATQDLSVLVAGIVGYVLANTLSPAMLDEWGWRIAFLIGASVVPFGLVIRRTLPETFEASSSAAKTWFTPELWRLAFLGVVLLSTITTAYFVIDYMTTFAENTLHISPTTAFAATVALGLTGTCFDVLGGILSDRFGRKPVVLCTGVVYILAIFPAYYAIVHFGSAAALIIGAALLGALQGLYAPPILIGITEGLPREIRSGALALIYAFGVSVFGAGTQFAVKGLITLTGNSLVPAAFMTVAITIGVIAMFFVRETAPVKVGLPER
jgi:MFS family permease